MNIISSYFTRSILNPFIIILLIIYSLFLFDRVYRLIALIETVNIDLLDFILLLLYSFPGSITTLVTISLSISVYSVTNNASSQYEFVGLQSLGVTLKKILFVVLLNSSLVGIVLIIVSLNITPISNYLLEKHDEKLRNQNLKFNLNPDSINIIGESLIYFDSRSGDEMKNLIIYINNGSENLIYAKSGKYSIDDDEDVIEIILNEGSFLMSAEKDGIQQIHQFKKATIPLKYPNSDIKNRKFINEDKWDQFEYLQTKPKSLLTVSDLYRLYFNENSNQNIRFDSFNEFIIRILFFFEAIALSLFAFGLGINNPRFSNKGNILLYIFGIVIYNQIIVSIRRIVSSNYYSPLLIIVPSIIFMIIGLVFFSFANKNKPIVFFDFNRIFVVKRIINKKFNIK